MILKLLFLIIKVKRKVIIARKQNWEFNSAFQ